MNWLAWLLFSFRGRIPRKSYWLAEVILLVLGIAGYLIINGPALPQHGPGSPLSIAWNFVLLLPGLAVAVKRLNDRGHTVWVAAIWLVSAGAGAIAAYFDFFADPMKLGRAEWALLAVFFAVGLWLLIDLGMLRGERGPNRHGPDPVGTAGDADAAQRPVGRRRSVGANIRDGVTGVVFLIAAFVLSGQNFGIPDLSHRAYRWLLMPKVIQTWEERQANEPAFKAQQEGDAAYSARDYDGAVRDFSRAIELYGPKSAAAAWSYRSRAFALQKVGRLHEALSDHDKAIALESGFTAGYRYRGVLLSELGRQDDALKDFDTALRRDPNSGDTLIARGEVLEKIGRRDDALTDYAQAITAEHNSYDNLIAKEEKDERRKGMTRRRDEVIARAHVRRGNTFRTIGRAEEALYEYAQAVELRPDDGFTYVNRGWLHEKQGHLDLARTDYEKAASLMTPDDWLKRALERTRQAP